ncbi:protein ANTAGONIST OF LIKE HETEROCHROMATIN PROTEIN 1 [Rhagoletis pomonella]|uniref:protein ANTAGONIST OF LIKE HETEROCHROMATIN PROTEIN 1 n=1 Tax=Rhagoletis pomonella TaxID=28610 RepID=UPI001781A757|nr:protein ANTAGONIST OF LIKE HETEROCHROMATIN PROTEIN 1 [Rhagoletis pomonella]
MGTNEILEGNWEKDFVLSLDNATATSAQGIVNNSHDSIMPHSSQFQSLAIKFAHENNLKARRKLLEIYRNHLMNFKRSILINRRRWQQRLQRRQALLRSFFMQHILELETSFLELIPIPKLGSIQLRKELPKALLLTEEPVAPVYMRKFYEDVMGIKSEEDCISNFRMRKSSFEWICDQLKEVMQPSGQTSPFHKLASHEQQIAMGLYAFATGNNYGEIARMFQITSRQTIYKFMKLFAEAILKKWGKQFLTMPSTEEEYDAIGNAFYNASNMPPVVIGVLGICELTTKSVKLNSNSNEPANSTIIMQMLIDNKLCFRKVKFDSNQPSLFLEETNEISNLPPKLISEKRVSRFVVTPDTYYPLRKWLMHKYQEPAVPHEFDFNEAVDNLFVFRDKALQRLFARWRILKWNYDLNSRTIDKIALACCVLHNVLEENEEPFEKEWAKWMNLESTKFTMSTRFKPVLNVLQGRSYSWEADGAAEVREFLGRTISSTEM